MKFRRIARPRWLLVAPDAVPCVLALCGARWLSAPMSRSVLTCVLLLTAGLASAQDMAAARSIFDKYQSREKAFDATIADLYCDSVLMRNVRTYRNGTQRTLELPAATYKAMIRSIMPLARAKGDFGIYSDATFVAEGSGIRIKATRHSQSKGYSSPISMLIGNCGTGSVGILEELSESQP